MPRDYAKKSPPPKKKAATPGWVWLLSGLLLGLFIAFLTYLASVPSGSRVVKGLVTPERPPQRAAPKPEPKPAPKRPARTEPEPEPEPPEEHYDFYKILPEMEVAVPDSATGGRKPTPARKIEEPGRYILQAGSFKQEKDADRRKAELALLGIISTIQRVTVNGNKTYHRVQVGPLEDLDRLQEVRKLLGENGIEYLVLKKKG